jgi:hypothetical protein
MVSISKEDIILPLDASKAMRETYKNRRIKRDHIQKLEVYIHGFN